MKKSLRSLICFLSVLFLVCSGFSADKSPFRGSNLIRIGLIPKAKKVKIKILGKTRIVDLQSNQIYKILKSITTYISSKNSKNITIGPFTFGPNIRIVPLEGEDKLKINGSSYRGNIYLKSAAGKKVTVIEELYLEDYLLGVLPMEMSPSWPIEALKAQAVVARTYALYNKKRFDRYGYDLSGDVRSQAYGGTMHNHPKIKQAVNSTRGEVLTYKGKIIHAFYHANCGGITSPPIWGGGWNKPLNGRKCLYCGGSHNYEWSLSITKKRLIAFLRSKNSKVSQLKSVKVLGKNKAKRVLRLGFNTNRGRIKVKPSDMRSYFGYVKFKSSFITRIVHNKNSITFKGFGFGHGVGMCQDGARGMAKKNKGYQKILEFYYPGVKIGKLNFG